MVPYDMPLSTVLKPAVDVLCVIIPRILFNSTLTISIQIIHLSGGINMDQALIRVSMLAHRRPGVTSMGYLVILEMVAQSQERDTLPAKNVSLILKMVKPLLVAIRRKIVW